MFSVIADSDNQPYLVLTALDWREHAAGAAGTDIAITYQALPGQDHFSRYGWTGLKNDNSSVGANEVTNLPLFDASDRSQATSDAANGFVMTQVAAAGYQDGATVRAGSGIDGAHPWQLRLGCRYRQCLGPGAHLRRPTVERSAAARLARPQCCLRQDRRHDRRNRSEFGPYGTGDGFHLVAGIRRVPGNVGPWGPARVAAGRYPTKCTNCRGIGGPRESRSHSGSLPAGDWRHRSGTPMVHLGNPCGSYQPAECWSG